MVVMIVKGMNLPAPSGKPICLKHLRSKEQLSNRIYIYSSGKVFFFKATYIFIYVCVLGIAYTIFYQLQEFEK